MKLLFILFAIIGLACAAQLPDSATQGPNPQDIATPEPEYIDIDLPEPGPAAAPAPAPAPAPVPVQARSFAAPRPVARPVQSFAPAPARSHLAPIQQLPGHTFSANNGYQYRRPVYVRRVYRRRHRY